MRREGKDQREKCGGVNTKEGLSESCMVLVITLLDVETMWLNSPKTLHPHFLTAIKMDSITTVTKWLCYGFDIE